LADEADIEFRIESDQGKITTELQEALEGLL